MMTREWTRIDREQRDIVRRHLTTVPVKLGALAHDLGLKVKISTMKPGQSGNIRKGPDGSYVIRVNRHEVRARQRFTLAHEIAHFLLHRDEIDRSVDGIVDNVLYRSGASENKEFEANKLAADLIMPPDEVARSLEQFGQPATDEIIEKMADLFKVSQGAMEVRLTTIPTRATGNVAA